MPEATLVDGWLDRWEELREGGEAVSAEQFAACHCGDAPPDLVAAFLEKARALQAMDANLNRARDPRTTRREGDTGAPRTAKAEPAEGPEPVPGYRLVRRIGRGGFGAVWEARGPGGFPLALKLIELQGHAGDAEAKALEHIKNVRHPHLLSVFGSWRTEALLVIACELAEGTLADRLRQEQGKGLPGIPWPDLIRYLREAAEGLDFLNRAGVQHRDVKPANLLLVGGSVKVGDLGLLKALRGGLASHTGLMTMAYAAPEAFEGRLAPQSDQYGLAVACCELRGGRLPFAGTACQLMRAHLNEPPDLTMLPAAERPAVARALEKCPEARWPSCAEFVEQLAAAARLAEQCRPKGLAGVEVTLANHTAAPLRLVNFTAEHGAYVVEPPPVIPAGGGAGFRLGGDGLTRGPSGRVLYLLDGHAGVCAFGYDVPLLWANSYEARCPPGFTVERSGGSGYDARVAFVLRPRPDDSR